jgi:acyl-CoA reductase-like NAD-dependent aldehyde dehydrogenase
VDPYERGLILQRLAGLIEENADELTDVEARDAGKLRGEAARDVDRAVRTWTYYAGWPTKITGTTNPADPGVFSYTVREPVGVVGAITPWNFPLVIACWKLAPALACGNTVVHKPAEEAPLSALRMAELALEAGVPPGVWNVVTGEAEAGAALAAHDDIDKITFTGSTEVGREIQRAAAGNLKRLSLELGGKSANIVLADADLDAALEGAMRSTFRNAGQVCTAGARLVAGHLDQAGEPLQDETALVRIHRPPRGERRPRSGDGAVDVARTAERERRERAARRRIERLEGLAGDRGHLVASDQVPAAATRRHQPAASSGCISSTWRSTCSTFARVARRMRMPRAIQPSMTYGAQWKIPFWP